MTTQNQSHPDTPRPGCRAGVHQGGEGQEDDAEQGQELGVEGGVDPGRPRDPQDEQGQAREEPSHQREQATHLVSPLG